MSLWLKVRHDVILQHYYKRKRSFNNSDIIYKEKKSVITYQLERRVGGRTLSNLPVSRPLFSADR